MKKKLLLIEDEIFIRELYEKVLQGAGYEIVGVPDGQEGLSKVHSEKFDLILLDVMLPKMTGIDVLRELKKDANSAVRAIPVFLLTNLGQESIIKEAFKLGAAGYLLKAKYLPNQVVSEVDQYFKNLPPVEPK